MQNPLNFVFINIAKLCYVIQAYLFIHTIWMMLMSVFIFIFIFKQKENNAVIKDSLVKSRFKNFYETT